jgi:hypothetical protein
MRDVTGSRLTRVCRRHSVRKELGLNPAQAGLTQGIFAPTYGLGMVI